MGPLAKSIGHTAHKFIECWQKRCSAQHAGLIWALHFAKHALHYHYRHHHHDHHHCYLVLLSSLLLFLLLLSQLLLMVLLPIVMIIIIVVVAVVNNTVVMLMITVIRLQLAWYLIAGDQTAHLLWRVLHGEVFEQHPPQLSIVLIGANDLSTAASCGASFVTHAAHGVTQR